MNETALHMTNKLIHTIFVKDDATLENAPLAGNGTRMRLPFRNFYAIEGVM